MTPSDLGALVAQIPDAAHIAIPPSRSGVAMAASRALVKRKARNLWLTAIPTSGIQADMLIGAGCVSVMESAGVTLDEQGQAPCFVRAVKEGLISPKDSTCPAIIAALQAGEKGIPFIPIRGLIGSDLVKYRPDYRVIGNPMTDGGDPIVCLPAIRPDVALFHAPLADRFGNVWIGKMRELMTMAHAARTTFVTVEAITDADLMQDELRAPATIPALYISALSRVEKGAWPLGLEGAYEADTTALGNYARAARTPEGFANWLANAHPQAAQ
ncbi:MAG: CoA transferase subunit A [Paracoccaceae bacterium]